MLHISLSGGLASAANALLAYQAREPFMMWFADTTVEDDDLYRFVYDLERLQLAPLIRLKDGRDPWDVFADEEYIGNSRTAPCSRVLKTELIESRLNALASPDDTIVIGFGFDEDERQARAVKRWAPRKVRSLIAEHFMGAGAVEQLVCQTWGIRKPRLYDMGFVHNNCGGMCVRAGQGQFALLLDKRPALYMKHEARNEAVRREIARRVNERKAAGTYKGKSGNGSSGGFIRVQRDGEIQYLHMREFRERVQSGELKPARYEMGGCGCFTDDA